MLEIERGNTRSHSVVNSLWKSLWTCHKTEDRMIKDIQLCLRNDYSFVIEIHLFMFEFPCIIS